MNICNEGVVHYFRPCGNLVGNCPMEVVLLKAIPILFIYGTIFVV